MQRVIIPGGGGNFTDRKRRLLQQQPALPDAELLQVNLWGDRKIFHKDPVQMAAADPQICGNIQHRNGIGIVLGNKIHRFLGIFQRKVYCLFVAFRILHQLRKEQIQVACHPDMAVILPSAGLIDLQQQFF